eukprot:m.292746 g.292746  ORF g.292746 m.292746 type:complete len:315 (-) comp12666_c0_seq1:61-1005(-)
MSLPLTKRRARSRSLAAPLREHATTMPWVLRPSLCLAPRASSRSARRLSTLSASTRLTSSTAARRASSRSFPVTLVRSSPRFVSRSTPRSQNGAKRARQRLFLACFSSMRCTCSTLSALPFSTALLKTQWHHSSSWRRTAASPLSVAPSTSRPTAFPLIFLIARLSFPQPSTRRRSSRTFSRFAAKRRTLIWTPKRSLFSLALPATRHCAMPSNLSLPHHSSHASARLLRSTSRTCARSMACSRMSAARPSTSRSLPKSFSLTKLVQTQRRRNPPPWSRNSLGIILATGSEARSRILSPLLPLWTLLFFLAPQQ